MDIKCYASTGLLWPLHCARKSGGSWKYIFSLYKGRSCSPAGEIFLSLLLVSSKRQWDVWRGSQRRPPFLNYEAPSVDPPTPAHFPQTCVLEERCLSHTVKLGSSSTPATVLRNSSVSQRLLNYSSPRTGLGSQARGPPLPRDCTFLLKLWVVDSC